jgi:hypothetical protein
VPWREWWLPGSHPHADRPNWQPATLSKAFRNFQEGLEKFSQRRTAKLLGENRSALGRYRWIAKLPEKLFTRLMRKPGRPASTKMLADISRAMAGKDTAEGELPALRRPCRA